jgi:sulfhydrogenase subunit beta (sulfur reductase)
MKKLPLSKLDELFKAVSASQKLYIPADDEAGQAKFTVWQKGVALSKKLNTVRSAKDLFFPQVENLVGFKVTGKQIELIESRDPSEPFVLFGVRACDARSFDVLDKVFLAEPVDTYYKSRRENGVVVTMACTHPAETCFCTVFGIDPTNPAGDVSCWTEGDALYWQANTEKGEKLTASLSMLEDSGDEAVKAQQEKTKEILNKLPLKDLNLKGFDGEHMMELFQSPKWASLSESCLGCGTCTFVCPTCQCYDIEEFNTGKEVKRFRCWDSCMYSDFTKMSAGQPRPTQLERFRQRFMHKLVYFPANNGGMYSCVGCGRCLQKCPISMNIAKVIKTLGEDKK